MQFSFNDGLKIRMLADTFSLLDLELFVRTAETGNLSRAARELALQPATASASLKRLEGKLSARLIVRSTRSLRLTPAGELFLQRARRALDALREARDTVNEDRSELRGTLRVAAPSDFGRGVLRPWLDEFQTLHPHLDIALLLSDRLADFYRESVDFALRYGVPDDSSLIVKPLAPNTQRIAVASPAYIERHGAPQIPEDLSQHAALAWVLSRSSGAMRVHDQWEFNRGRERRKISVHVRRASDDGAVVRDWAVAGYGIAYKSALDVAADLRAGRLVRLLEDWDGEVSPLNLVLAFRDYQPPAVREALQFITDKIRAGIE
jgi:DNA-binding transcriptional LysR family regulator